MTMLRDDDPRHGTTNAYRNLGCRCQACRDANADAQAEYRDRLATTPARLIPHGTVNGYENYKCRCVECRRVHAASDRARNQRKKLVQDS